MSTSLSQPRPARERTLLQSVIGGAAIACGLLTAIVLTGQWSATSATASNVLTQIGRWLGAAPAADSRVYWYMSRSAGVVAYVLLWGSVAWGLLVSNKLLEGLARPALTYELHQFLSLLALAAGVFHGFVLLGDKYMSFSVLDLLIPFRAAYQPVGVGLGILGLYLAAIIAGSFYIKKRIGQRAWRTLHYFSFAAWVMITLHGVVAGTDTVSTLMKVTYSAAIVSVGYLLTYRILTAKQRVARA